MHLITAINITTQPSNLPRASTIPTAGMFVVFTFDPVASAAYLENADFTAACKELAPKQKKFLAFVERDIDGPFPWNQYNPFRFHLIWQGLEHLPKPMERYGVQSNMIFPILPNTYHPTYCPKHGPVAPQQPLPWKDCYLSGRVKLEVRCETEWQQLDASTSTSPLHQTTLQEAARVVSQMHYDGSAVYRKIAEELPQSSPREETASFSSDLSSSCDTKALEKPSDDGVVLTERIIALLTSCRELEDKFIVQCSTDLSSMDAINHPDELYQELAHFEKLKSTFEVDRKHQQIEEARRIDDEHFAKLHHSKSSCGFSLGKAGLLLRRLGSHVKGLISGQWLRKLQCAKDADQRSL